MEDGGESETENEDERSDELDFSFENTQNSGVQHEQSLG